MSTPCQDDLGGRLRMAPGRPRMATRRPGWRKVGAIGVSAGQG